MYPRSSYSLWLKKNLIHSTFIYRQICTYKSHIPATNYVTKQFFQDLFAEKIFHGENKKEKKENLQSAVPSTDLYTLYIEL